MIKTILTIIFIIICVFLSAVILLQEGKSAGLSGSIGGMADSYWGRNKSRSMEGKLEKLTKICCNSVADPCISFEFEIPVRNL